MLTVLEAARRIRRHPETIRRWIWSGRLRSQKVGNRHFVAEAELDHVAAEAVSERGVFVEWLEQLYRLHDEIGFRPSGLPSGAELLRAEREAH